MAQRFFLKENPASPFIVAGAIVSFDIHGSMGYRALDPENPDEAKLLAELDKAIAMRRGGIVEITQAQYDLKKNLPASGTSRPSSPWQQPPRLMPRPSAPAPKPAAPAAGVVKLVETEVSKKLREYGIDPAKALKPAPPATPPATAPPGPEPEPRKQHVPMTRRVPIQTPEVPAT